MNRFRLQATLPKLFAAGLAVSTWTLTGCGAGPVAVSIRGEALQGKVFGGQQPVANSSIALYAASSNGYGQPYTYTSGSQLLTSAVATDAMGKFSIKGDYVCPSASTEVYLVATQGNPGLAGNVNNSAIALMAALGPCGLLTANTAIQVNEVTTVASVWALSPFMSSISGVGTSATNVAGLVNAFNSVNKIVNVNTGTLGGPALAPGATISGGMVFTLADILAACINSSGPADAGGACANLFRYTTVNGTAPADTITAAMNIAQHPGTHTADLFGLASQTPPYIPVLPAAPSAFSIVVSYGGAGTSAPSGIAVDGAGQVWIPNSGNSTLSVLSQSGLPIAGSPFTGNGLNAPSAVAIDNNGTAWIANAGGNSLSSFTSTGASRYAVVTGSGLNAPTTVAVDALGLVWVGNGGGTTVSVFTSNGGFENQVVAGSSVTALAIDPK